MDANDSNACEASEPLDVVTNCVRDAAHRIDSMANVIVQQVSKAKLEGESLRQFRLAFADWAARATSMKDVAEQLLAASSRLEHTLRVPAAEAAEGEGN